MSTGAVIAVAIGALVLIALVAWVSVVGRRRRLESRREQAGEIRQEAQSRELRAARERAVADEQAARARQAQAEAEERAQVAERESRFARERHEEAQSVDPDTDQEEESLPARPQGRS